MKTIAVLSLFTLAPAVVFTPAARAQVQAPEQPQVALAQPTPMPEPYQPPPDPYDTAADPSQIDWPQDVAGEEPAVDSYDDGYDPQAYTDFQDELAPYGNWVDDGTYGRVWQPEASLVGDDFTPYYSGGHWVLTEFGWTWVSDWSWGWAPFHYGRWIIVAGYGWCWVPGTIWGPAWVAWRAGDGWVGWAALPPRGVSVTATYGARSPWRFSRGADLGAPRPRCVPVRDARGMFHRTTLVTNDRVLTRSGTTVHINAGPRHITNAPPVRLTSVAPQAFPQRAILPRPGATMSARPWIRAASGAGGGVPASSGGSSGRAGAPAGARPGGVFGQHPSWHAPLSSNPSSSTLAPRIYNPPRAWAPAPHAGGQPSFATTAPRIYNPPQAFSGSRHIYNPPAPASAPRIDNSPALTSTPQVYGRPQSWGAVPRAFGGAPAQSPVQVYSPPARTFAAPPVSHAPALPPHQSFSPPQMHTAAPPPAHSFSAPAPSGSFGHVGGAHFGGGHRR
jgi:hypothetical protein